RWRRARLRRRPHRLARGPHPRHRPRRDPARAGGAPRDACLDQRVDGSDAHRGQLMGYRVGVDVGGTLTELICVTPDGEGVLDTPPRTPDDQSVGVMNSLQELADRFARRRADFCGEIDILVHGTTTADNTMIEMNGAPTGLLVTEGHRDEIEMRRVHKEEIWDPTYPAPPPIARRRARIPLAERMNFPGQGLPPLDEAAVRRGVQRLK